MTLSRQEKAKINNLKKQYDSLKTGKEAVLDKKLLDVDRLLSRAGEIIKRD